jgi:hypothetical protein
MDDFENEFLESGHGARTPVSDTYFRRFLINWLEANEAMGQSIGAATVRDAAFWASDAGRPASYANTATFHRPLPADPTEAMERLERFFAAQDTGQRRETYIFSPWPTPDLRPFGWRLGGHPPLHILPEGKTRPETPAGVRVERVTTAQSLALLERIAIEGFPMEGIDGSTPGNVFGSGALVIERMRFWLGYLHDEPVGVAVTSIDHGINQVMLIVTLPEARGQGLGSALTWEASLADPALPAMLLSSDLGRRVYNRMGYLALFRWSVWYRARQ